MKKNWIVILMIASGAIIICLSYNFWDIPVAIYCRNLNQSIRDLAEIVTRFGESKWYFLVFVPAFLLLRFVSKNNAWAMKVLFLVIAISASGIINAIVKWIAGRNRPINLFDFGFYGFNFFAVIYESTSFPSGHALTVFSLAAAMTILCPRAAYLVFPAAFAIAASRVILTAHYVSDVVAGAVLGVICTLVVQSVFKRFQIELGSLSKEYQ